ncbi:unnamed protein product [Sphenostylis stenocarpa]|uniref:Uncharacterized protein n=1 Tax=Sphenostylis stenocarpa TaxID=92480 RepID=A0AA86VBE4_9FABA|nr:unnamed protein product [Sphenostylis stenocarpa]
MDRAKGVPTFVSHIGDHAALYDHSFPPIYSFFLFYPLQGLEPELEKAMLSLSVKTHLRHSGGEMELPLISLGICTKQTLAISNMCDLKMVLLHVKSSIMCFKIDKLCAKESHSYHHERYKYFCNHK